MSSNPQYSQFAEVLRALFDKTEYMTRDEWSQLLGIETERLESWLTDKNIPRHDHLFVIFDLLRNKDILQKPVQDFLDMAKKRATDVSPLGALMLPTVWEYMTRQAFGELSTVLARMTREEQAEYLLQLFAE